MALSEGPVIRVLMDRKSVTEYLQVVFPNPRDSENARALNRAQENQPLAECLVSEGQKNQLKGVTRTLYAT